MRKAILTAVFAVLLALAVQQAAMAVNRPTLKTGQADVRACGLKWELSGPKGHRPNVFTVQGTYKLPLRPNCNYFGSALGKAIAAYKYRLGYPSNLVKPIAGPYFFALLKGTKHRPLLWVALAQRRAKAIQQGPTQLAQQIVAFEARQVGTHETCGGSCNRGTVRGPGGYSVDDIQRSQGARGLAWCGIFQAFGFGHFGIEFAPPPYNRFFVPSIGQWGLNHGYALVKGKRRYQAYITARARVGSLVAFLASSTLLSGKHVGIVSSISAKGYYTIEGNSSDAVTQHWYPWGSALRVFINVPGVA